MIPMQQRYDVVVVGSGAGGLFTAIRAHELGCSVAVIEKADRYGGTTAASAGGVWIPVNQAVASKDSKELAMTYLRAVTGAQGRESMLATYVDNGPAVIKYLAGLGVTYVGGSPFPDYFSELPGAIRGRSMLPIDMDGKLLGEDFCALRESHPATRLLNRYSLNSKFAATLGTRAPGWKKTLMRILWDYWSDIPWRLKTSRDRRLTMGRALIGGLRKALAEKGIPLFLNTPLVRLMRNGQRVTGVRVSHGGRMREILADKGVVLASGGFENSQSERDRYLNVATRCEHSAAPIDGANTGDGLRLAVELGAATEFLANAWWCPCVAIPASDRHAVPVSYPVFFDRAKPGTLSVNRAGLRFVNESVSYDLFGSAMVQDQLTTHANAPCWMIFDSQFRAKYAAGPILPAWAMADRAIPSSWWDSVVYRADDIAGLARKIALTPAVLSETVSRFNRGAERGVDDEFGRGTTDAQRAIGDAAVRPNPTLAPLTQAPFYAVQISLGDLGTRGGLKTDENGAVVDESGKQIPGLFATGDVAATIFGDTYPGGGGAIGPAMVFGYLAAAELARR